MKSKFILLIVTLQIFNLNCSGASSKKPGNTDTTFSSILFSSTNNRSPRARAISSEPIDVPETPTQAYAISPKLSASGRTSTNRLNQFCNNTLNPNSYTLTTSSSSSSATKEQSDSSDSDSDSDNPMPFKMDDYKSLRGATAWTTVKDKN